MLSYPQIDPVAIAVGPLRLHWYGITYIAGFIAAWLLGRYRASRPGSGWRPGEVDDLITCSMVGVLLGARLGYAFFYDPDTYLADPLEILRVWNGGMSFHGGLLGVLLAALLWKFAYRRRFLAVTDFLAPLVPLGLLCGRIGNFINAELWGKVTPMEWGMVFPGAGSQPRHPTQLYEAGLEGLLLFLILWIYSRKPRPLGAVSGLFAVWYSLFRMGVEFFRMPDGHIGYLFFGWVTMGQLLCLPLLLLGALLLLVARHEERHPSRDRIVLKDGSVVWVKRR
jgi:phosphatidylglycerol:prolipoprotein diacylglycerol transferase